MIQKFHGERFVRFNLTFFETNLSTVTLDLIIPNISWRSDLTLRNK